MSDSGDWKRLCGMMFIAAILCGVSTDTALGFTVAWFPETPRQGDVVHFVVGTGEKGSMVQGRFLEHELFFFTLPGDPGSYHAMDGIDLSSSRGTHTLTVNVSEGRASNDAIRIGIQVLAREFPEEHLTLPDRMVVLDDKTRQRVEQEQNSLIRLFSDTTPERFYRGPFILPVNGELGSPFGLRRTINGQPRSPHTGQDVKAPQGTPVVASNSGRVVMTEDFFFPGKLVVLDHGQGLYTIYFHLSEVMVSVASFVHKGDVIGKVGSSGRASGPHLHWGARLRGARVDPVILVKSTHFLVE